MITLKKYLLSVSIGSSQIYSCIMCTGIKSAYDFKQFFKISVIEIRRP